MNVERLREIQEEMLVLLDEASAIVKSAPSKIVYERARAYWMAQMKMALTNEHEFLGSASVSMDDTIEELEELEDEQEEN